MATIKRYDIPEVRDLYQMKETDIPAFAHCAAEAYRGYPYFEELMRFKYNDEKVARVMALAMGGAFDQALCIAPDDTPSGFAYFLPPGYHGTGNIPYIRAGALKLPFTVAPDILFRLISYENYTMRLKQLFTRHDGWYLLNLTVRPDLQGQGVATSLMQPMCDYFDRTGQLCYLETHKAENVPFYERFGFELLQAEPIPHRTTVHYCMRRMAK